MSKRRGLLYFFKGNAAVKQEEPDFDDDKDPTVVTKLYENLDAAMGQAEEEMEKTAKKAKDARSAFKKPDSYDNVTRHLSYPPKS